jgi:hypothetical protein
MAGGLARGQPASSRTSPRPARGQGLALLVALLLAVVAVGLAPGTGHVSTVASAEDVDPLLAALQQLALEDGKVLVVSPGGIVTDEDPLDDVDGPNSGLDDIGRAGYAFLPEVPSWLLAELGCGKPNVACPASGSDDGAFSEGAYAFFERLAGSPESLPAGSRGEWGPMLALDRYPPSPRTAGESFSGASHAVITRLEGSNKDVLYFAYTGGAFQMYRTNARSMWVDRDFLTIVPKAGEILTPPVAWDVYAATSDGSQAGTGRDSIRGFSGAALLPFSGPPTIEFEDAPIETSSPSVSPAVSPAVSPTPTGEPSLAPSPTLEASPGPTGRGEPGDPSAFIGDLVNSPSGRSFIGLAMVVIAAGLFFGRRAWRGSSQAPPPRLPDDPPAGDSAGE